MDWRRDFFLSGIDKKQLGLEIGPSHSPIVKKSEGYNVKIVDHTDKAGLVKKYKSMNIDTKNIEEVDFVWDGKKNLTELTGLKGKLDYIIASHVLEHTTDLLSFLQDCEALLKRSGKLFIALPDKRCCFDYFRFPSNIGDVLDAYHQKRTLHSPGKVYEFLINSVDSDNKRAWSLHDDVNASLLYEHDFVKAEYNRSLRSKKYIDIHNWLFTPESFKLLIHDLQKLEATKLSYVKELSTQGFEFFAVLSPSAKKLSKNRMHYLEAMFSDMRYVFTKEEEKLKNDLNELRIANTNLESQLASIINSRRWRVAEKLLKPMKLFRRRMVSDET